MGRVAAGRSRAYPIIGHVDRAGRFHQQPHAGNIALEVPCVGPKIATPPLWCFPNVPGFVGDQPSARGSHEEEPITHELQDVSGYLPCKANVSKCTKTHRFVQLRKPIAVELQYPNSVLKK